jgi:phage gp45-like
MVGGSKHRPKNLKKGEQALYDDQGQLFGVLRDCVLLKTPHKFRIEGDVEIDGNVTISGTSEAADHISDGKSGKSHTHTDSVSGQTTEPL